MAEPPRPDRPAAADLIGDPVPSRWLTPTDASDDRTAGVFTLAVVCELTGLHEQTLRKWDRLDVVSPQRSAGGQRRYSRSDLDRLLLVRHLVVDRGLNLAGVRAVLELAETLAEEREANRHLRDTLRRVRDDQPPQQALLRAVGGSGATSDGR